MAKNGEWNNFRHMAEGYDKSQNPMDIGNIGRVGEYDKYVPKNQEFHRQMDIDQMRRTQDEALSMSPVLRDAVDAGDFQFAMPKPVPRGQDPGGFLEYYSKDETGIGDYMRPTENSAGGAYLPNVGGVELRRPDTTALDVLGDYGSHQGILPVEEGGNQRIRDHYAYFKQQQAENPDDPRVKIQKEMLDNWWARSEKERGDYINPYDKGKSDKQRRNEWEERSGMAGLFRAQPFDQWKGGEVGGRYDKIFTENQINSGNNMVDYMTGKEGKTIPWEGEIKGGDKYPEYPAWDSEVFDMAGTRPKISTGLQGKTFDEYNQSVAAAPKVFPTHVPNALDAEVAGYKAANLPKQQSAPAEVDKTTTDWRDNQAIKEIISKDPIIEKIIMTESSGKPNARNKGTGARGLMQIMRNTAELDTGYGVNYNLGYDELDDPEKNVKYGAAYFKGLRKYFGNSDKDALIAYNWGPGNLRNFKKKGYWVDKSGKKQLKIPKETRDYVKKILGISVA
jgi:hypothetical protein